MLDIELIRTDPEYVRTALLKRTDQVDLDAILEADALRRKLNAEVDTARSERNRQAKEIGKLKASEADTSEAQKQAAALGDQITADAGRPRPKPRPPSMTCYATLPNLPDDRVPGRREGSQPGRPYLGQGSPSSATSRWTTLSCAPAWGSSTTPAGSSSAATATGSTPDRARPSNGR